MADEIEWGKERSDFYRNEKTILDLEKEVKNANDEIKKLKKDLEELKAAIEKAKAAKSDEVEFQGKKIKLDDATKTMTEFKEDIDEKEATLETFKGTIEAAKTHIKEQITRLGQKSPVLLKYITSRRLEQAQKKSDHFEEVKGMAEKLESVFGKIKSKGDGPEKDLAIKFDEFIGRDSSTPVTEADIKDFIALAKKVDGLDGFDPKDAAEEKALIDKLGLFFNECQKNVVKNSIGKYDFEAALAETKKKAETFKGKWDDQIKKIQPDYVRLATADEAKDYYTRQALQDYFAKKESDAKALSTINATGFWNKIKYFFTKNSLERKGKDALAKVIKTRADYDDYMKAEAAQKAGKTLTPKETAILADAAIKAEVDRINAEVATAVKTTMDANKADKDSVESFRKSLSAKNKGFVDRLADISAEQDVAEVEKEEEER